jgi:uncharacterized protein (DUF488 family)
MALMVATEIFTIGHSNQTWDAFAALLRQHGVQVLADVRTTPKSRHAPFASLSRLPGLLGGEGVTYVFLGDSLGGKPADGSCYDQKGRPDYHKIRSKVFFRKGIEELLKLVEGSTVAIMCAEEDPSKCHRTLLIGPALEPHGVALRHIRGDGLSVQQR